ncbi:MAG TPA: hypothetical protein DEF04_05140 [Clostridiales bacterium]|nr:hypothetical protein [Clostridiales bacterium]
MFEWKKIIYSVIIIYIMISLVLNYLIKTNKIKSGKVLRLFIESDEEFIKHWETNNKDGIIKYAISNFRFYVIILFITGIFYMVNNINFFWFDHKYTIVVALMIGMVLGIVDTFIGWRAMGDRYNILTKKIEDDSKIDEKNKE